MKTSLLSATAIALALSAGTALAADLPYRKEAPPAYIPPPPLITWTGFYGGLNAGGGWSANSINNNNWTPYTDPGVGGSLFLLPGSANGGSNAGGVVGGGQIGYNYQFNSFLVGVETDFQGTSMSSGGNNAATTYLSPLGTGNLLVPLAPNGNIGVSLNWFGTVRGRAGYLLTPTLLLYGTAGFAYGGVSGNFTGVSNTRTGWTAGGGAEWMFMPNWSAKLEYNFIDLDSGGRTNNWTGFQWGYHRHPQLNVVRAGVNYHFNWGVAPTLARY